MKNILLGRGQVFVVMAIFCFSFLFFPKNAMAISTILDQQCRVTADKMGSMSITNRTDVLNQTFVPTMDHLYAVSLYVEGDGVGTMTLSIKQDSPSGDYYFNSNGAVAEPNGKGTVLFLFGDVSVVTGTNYILTPSASDKSMLNWFYQESCYRNGFGFMGNVINSFDFAFSTYGYSLIQAPQPTSGFVIPNLTSSLTPTKATTPTATPTSSPTSAPTGMGNKEMGIFEPTASPTPTAKVTPSTGEPSVEYVLNGSEKVENLDGVIELSDTSEFVLYGTGEKDSKIIVTLGNDNYEVVVDGNGNWSLQLPLSKVDAGTYTVTATGQISGVSSDVSDLVTIRVNKESTAGASLGLPSNFSDYYPYIAGVLILLLGLTIFGLFLNGRKNNALVSLDEKPSSENSSPIVEDLSPKTEIK